MHDKIKELAGQAGCYFGSGLEFAVVFGELDDFKKFAELIVRECANVGLETHGNYDVHDDILKHFGVEE